MNTGTRVLELGCGTRRVTAALLETAGAVVGDEWYVLVSRGVPVLVEADNPCLEVGSVKKDRR